MDTANKPRRENAGRSDTRRGVGRPTMAVGTVLLLGLLAVGTIATAGHFGFGRHGRHPDPERMRAHADFVMERVLSAVDATPEQAEQIQAIADGALDDLGDLHAAGGAMHDQFVAALTAAEIDRDGLEALRQEKLAAMDAASSRIVEALTDASEVLTPAQRTTLAQHIEERHARRHDHHWGK